MKKEESIGPNDARIHLEILNSSTEAIICRNILCQSVDGLNIGWTVQPQQSGAFSSRTNDRVFVLFQGLTSGTEYQLAMTCPKSSPNSAAGYGSGGLQTYDRSGTPVTFRFCIGSNDMADWGHGDEYTGDSPDFGNCSI